jgi:glutathione S-transferase
MSITLYEFSTSRSARARWTLLELNAEYESVEDRSLIGSDKLRAIHPLAKLPALTDDGRNLFESAAICTWLADSHPDSGLISPSGTWERALHDQWVAFTLSEVEAHLWSTARNTFIYPEDRRITAIYEQNASETKRALRALDDHFADTDYLVANTFSVTDIIVVFAVNWARRAGLTEGFANLQAYNERLLARPHCTLNRE